jgi:mannitol 2-dehydrogenase
MNKLLLNPNKELSTTITVPTYAKSSSKYKIMHVGVGNFARSHHFTYIDMLNNLSSSYEWSVIGIGLLPQDLEFANKLHAQDFYYSVLTREDNLENIRINGCLENFLIVGQDLPEIIEVTNNPDLKIISLTITEGGYFTKDRKIVDLTNPQIQRDLTHNNSENTLCSTIYGFLRIVLNQRMILGESGRITLLSCDNILGNGDCLKNCLIDFLSKCDPELLEWVLANVSFPNSMVDRITPKAEPTIIKYLKDKWQVNDNCPVVCEPYIQWVIEDKFINGRPELEKLGVSYVTDVHPYEDLKLKVLNASHSIISYPGILLGYTYVHEAINDPLIAKFLESAITTEVLPFIDSELNVDPLEYFKAVKKRFSNSLLADSLERICSNGSDKLFQFILPSIDSGAIKNSPQIKLKAVFLLWGKYLNGLSENQNNFTVIDERLDLVGYNGDLLTLVSTTFNRDFSLISEFNDLSSVKLLLQQLT